jgi:hypothetical protein
LKEKARWEEDNTSNKAREAIYQILTPDFECHEPPTLPHGGVHKGRDNWRKMSEHMDSLWHQEIEPVHVWDFPDEDLIVLHSVMTWTAHSTRKSATFPAIELLYFRDGKMSKCEVILQDTKLILDTLDPAVA